MGFKRRAAINDLHLLKTLDADHQIIHHFLYFFKILHGFLREASHHHPWLVNNPLVTTWEDVLATFWCSSSCWMRCSRDWQFSCFVTSIYWSIYLSSYLLSSTRLSIHQSICPSIHRAVYLSLSPPPRVSFLAIYPSIYLPVYLFIYLHIYLSVYLSAYLLIFLSTYLALYLFRSI